MVRSHSQQPATESCANLRAESGVLQIPLWVGASCPFGEADAGRWLRTKCLLCIFVIEILWLSMTSVDLFSYSLDSGGGERRLLALMGLNEDFRSDAQRSPQEGGNNAEGACREIEARRRASRRSRHISMRSSTTIAIRPRTTSSSRSRRLSASRPMCCTSMQTASLRT